MQDPTCPHCHNPVPLEAVLCPSCGNWWKTDQSVEPPSESTHEVAHEVRRSLNSTPTWAKALLVGVLLITVIWVGMPPASTAPSFPPTDQVLAEGRAGGWTSVDFLYEGDPVAAAVRCVDGRPGGPVTCFAFASREDYRRSQPRGAGNFVHTCWDGRASRDKTGRESSSRSFAKTSGC